MLKKIIILICVVVFNAKCQDSKVVFLCDRQGEVEKWCRNTIVEVNSEASNYKTYISSLFKKTNDLRELQNVSGLSLVIRKFDVDWGERMVTHTPKGKSLFNLLEVIAIDLNAFVVYTNGVFIIEKELQR